MLRSFVQSMNQSTGGQLMAIMRNPLPVSFILYTADSDYFLSPSILFSPLCIYKFLPFLLPSVSCYATVPPHLLCFFHPLMCPPLSVSRTCVKRSLAMRLVRAGGRRISNSSSWLRCCRCPGPSPASWTKPQSSGWPSATCTCAPLPARGTRPGALCWRVTATAAKVSKWETSKKKTERLRLLWH